MNFDKELDARGLNCPLPILRAKKTLAELQPGQVLRIIATDPQARINLNPLTDLYEILTYTFSRSKTIVLCILGISWFYFMGGMFLAQLPNFVRSPAPAGTATSPPARPVGRS